MTVQTETSRSGPYAGAGTTGPFTVGFRFLSGSHLRVIRTTAAGIDSTLVLDTDYAVSGAGGSTGTVTLTSALASGEKLTIVRDVPFTQNADYVPGDAFPAESHEDALDLLTMQTQQLAEAQGRALTLPVTVSGASNELPSPSGLKVFGWNAAGTAIENLDANTLASIIAYGTAASDLFDGDGVTTEFSLSGNPASINNLDVSIGGVAQRPGLDYLWTNGTIVTFTTAPAVGTDNILVRYMQALAMGSSVASDVSYTPSGVGAAVTTVQSKLRESVSVKDFGAVGDGVTDDRPAFTLAVTYAASLTYPVTIEIPVGEYAFLSGEDTSRLVTLKPNISFKGHGTRSKIKIGNGVFGVANVFGFSGSAPLGVVQFEDFYCDLNGQNNLRGSGEPARNNALVNAAYFIGVLVSRVTASNAPGNQIIWAHSPLNSVASWVSVLDCKFDTVGASISGNTNADHSTVYAEANHCSLYRNTFSNAAMAVATANTAMELHGEYCYQVDNVVTNYNRGSHMVFLDTQNISGKHWIVRGNYYDTRLAGVALWTDLGAATSDVYDVLIEGNTFKSNSALSSACSIDAVSFITTAHLHNLTVKGNRFLDQTLAGQTAIHAGANVYHLDVIDNSFRNYQLGVVTSLAGRTFAFQNNDLYDCAKGGSGNVLVSVDGPVTAATLTGNTITQTSAYSENAIVFNAVVQSAVIKQNHFAGFYNDYPVSFAGAGLGSVSAIVEIELYLSVSVAPVASNYATFGSRLTNLQDGRTYLRASAGFGNTWYQIDKNTTANRAVLGNKNMGQIYFDTTLNVNGKPIWWTGTAWVDATGLVV